MKTVNISQLRNKLSAILDTLPHVGAIRVVDRRKPIAVIYPVASSEPDLDAERLLALERAGVITRQTTPLDRSILTEPPVRLKRKVDAVKILIEERRRGL